MFNPKANDYQTSEHRGFYITSYLAKGSYKHRRISSVTNPEGQKISFVETGINIGFTHDQCVKYATRKIDYHLDGENSEMGKLLKWQRENPNSLY